MNTREREGRAPRACVPRFCSDDKGPGPVGVQPKPVLTACSTWCAASSSLTSPPSHLPSPPSHPPPAPPPAGLPDCPRRPQPVSLSPGPTGRDAHLPPLCPPYPKGGQEPRSCSLQGRLMSEQGWRRDVTKSRVRPQPVWSSLPPCGRSSLRACSLLCPPLQTVLSTVGTS